MTYDFCGYATRSGVKCSDGRTIMPDAFRDDDGKKVPLVWNHQHNSPDNVLGHAILENRKDGVYAYATFNDNDVGQRAKELVRHGDISALSIYANKLKETAGKVMHGVIREVSLVLAGANPEAMIDSFVAHSDGNVVEDREQGQFYSGLEGELYHAEDDSEDKDQEEDAEDEARMKRIEKMRQLRKKAQDELKEEDAKTEEAGENEEEEDEKSDSDESDAAETEDGEDGEDDENEEEEDEKVKHADSDDSDDSDEDETVGDILNTFNEKQKTVVMAMLQSAIAAAEKKQGDGDSSDEEKEEAVEHADSEDSDKDETVGDILNSLTDKQKVVVMALLENALEAARDEKTNQDEDNEEEPQMKHNVFDNDTQEANVLSHSDEMKIIDMAKDSSIGTLKGAMKAFCDNESMAHGFDSQSISIMFPEYKDVKTGAPEMLTTDQGWITKVLDKVHKIPMTKVRVRFSDIRDIEDIRAKGYTKGTQKALTGDIAALYRVADAQTVYVRSDLNRDDILDITDFDYVAYMYGVDKMLLNEELATAIMLGDGRAVNNQYKIKEDRIIPIWTDSELFTIHATVDMAAARTSLQGTNTNAYFGDNFVFAEAMAETLMNARVDAKNSGQADLFISPRALNKMLLARDRNGRRIYNTLEELRSALNVREIITAEQFEGKTRTVTETIPDPEHEGQTTTQTVTKRLLGILTKMENYDLGANKGGEITHFTDFDLDFNKEKSLLETRVSGMQVRPLSSVVLEENVTD